MIKVLQELITKFDFCWIENGEENQCTTIHCEDNYN